MVAELYRRGWVAAQTGRGTAGIDVMAHRPDGSVQVDIQVKATTTRVRRWPLNEKAERLRRRGPFYALVHFVPDGPPVTYIVPSEIVADYVARSHRAWRGQPGRRGQMHNPTPMRSLKDRMLGGIPENWLDEYREAWHLLDAEIRG